MTGRGLKLERIKQRNILVICLAFLLSPKVSIWSQEFVQLICFHKKKHSLHTQLFHMSVVIAANLELFFDQKLFSGAFLFLRKKYYTSHCLGVFFALLRTRSKVSSLRKDTQASLLWGKPEVFQGQPRDVVSPEYPRSSPGPPFSGTYLEYLPREASRGKLTQILKLS